MHSLPELGIGGNKNKHKLLKHASNSYYHMLKKSQHDLFAGPFSTTHL